MNRNLSGLVVTTLAALFSTAGAAKADGPFDVVRLGVLEHDTDVVGSNKEDGTDIGLEILSAPVSQLRIIGAPRVVVGGLVNTEGQTNQIYAGLLAQWSFSKDVFRTGDAFFLEGMVGGAWHDGETDVTGTPEEQNWKSHGSELVFRTGFGVGYHINERWSLALDFAHISNADTAQPNEGANDVGLRLGYKL
jgi:lipid A 3-O-deacylase